jgi:hypothetical protein
MRGGSLLGGNAGSVLGGNQHAPFRRNDQLLSVVPYGLIVFPGSGITDNLADKARRLGIPVWRFAEGGA